MNASRARVSVVVPTRDRPGLLADALRSVARQTAAPFELIVADDGDHPLALPAAVAEPISVRVLRSPHRNLAATRNLAAAAASGEWLAFLDDDDCWQPDHLSGMAEAMADPGTQLLYRDVVVVRERVAGDGTRIDEARRTIARDWDLALMRHHDYVPPSTWAVRRAAFEAAGGFDETMRYSEDWDLLMRLSATTTPRRVPGVTVEVRMRETGHLSTDSGPERQACLDRLSSRYGLPPLTIKTFWEVADVVARADDLA